MAGRSRRVVSAQDPRPPTQRQQWRVIGSAYLPLQGHGVQPGPLAVPAGVGDVPVGLAALLQVRTLAAPGRLH